MERDTARGTEVVGWLRGAAPATGVVILAAHPDDETAGLGAHLPELTRAVLVHVTDGAPRDRRWWGAPHCADRETYARVRREELASALALAGFPSEQVRGLGLVDQEASLDLAHLARSIADLLRELRPDIVLTHPYEGGHPDHDATAFAVHAACRLLERRGIRPPRLIEFASYFSRGGELVVGDFLPWPGSEPATVVLSADQRELKARLLACFASQRETLAAVPRGVERFRLAPRYDFTLPPHEGTLHYERFDWGVTGAEWRRRAREAARELGLGGAGWA